MFLDCILNDFLDSSDNYFDDSLWYSIDGLFDCLFDGYLDNSLDNPGNNPFDNFLVDYLDNS